jgi:hypothetical protein
METKPKCSEPGCESDAFSKGLCRSHVAKMRQAKIREAQELQTKIAARQAEDEAELARQREAAPPPIQKVDPPLRTDDQRFDDNRMRELQAIVDAQQKQIDAMARQMSGKPEPEPRLEPELVEAELARCARIAGRPFNDHEARSIPQILARPPGNAEEYKVWLAAMTRDRQAQPGYAVKVMRRAPNGRRIAINGDDIAWGEPGKTSRVVDAGEVVVVTERCARWMIETLTGKASAHVPAHV